MRQPLCNYANLVIRYARQSRDSQLAKTGVGRQCYQHNHCISSPNLFQSQDCGTDYVLNTIGQRYPVQFFPGISLATFTKCGCSASSNFCERRPQCLEQSRQHFWFVKLAKRNYSCKCSIGILVFCQFLGKLDSSRASNLSQRIKGCDSNVVEFFFSRNLHQSVNVLNISPPSECSRAEIAHPDVGISKTSKQRRGGLLVIEIS